MASNKPNQQELEEPMDLTGMVVNPPTTNPVNPAYQQPNNNVGDEVVEETGEDPEPIVGDGYVGKPKSKNPIVISALQAVKQYVLDMDPRKPQNVDTLKMNQLSLANALYTILATEDPMFKESYTEVLSIVKSNINTVFSAINRNRGLNDIPLTTLDNGRMNFFTRLLDLMTLTVGGHGTESVKRHFDFGRFLSEAKNPNIQRNINSYYSV